MSLMFIHLTNLQLFIITLYFNWIVWLHFFPNNICESDFKCKLDLISFKYLFELWLLEFLRSFLSPEGLQEFLELWGAETGSLVYKEAWNLMYRLRRDSYSCFPLFSWHESLRSEIGIFFPKYYLRFLWQQTFNIIEWILYLFS